MKKFSLPIEVAHCIEEYTDASPRVDNNTIHRNMPILFIGVVVIDVPLPCGDTVIAPSVKEHFSGEMNKGPDHQILATLQLKKHQIHT